MAKSRLLTSRIQSFTPRTAKRAGFGRVWIGPLLVLCLAGALRLWQLDDVPPGLTHDEANNVHDAAFILRGVHPLYFPVAQGKEPLYLYSVAMVMALAGSTPLAMRFTSAMWGVLLVALTHAWARKAFGRSVALWAAGGLALSFWGVSTSRMGLRAITWPVFLTAALLTSRLAERRRPGFADSLVAGLCLGLTLYTYLAARVIPVLLVLFGLTLAITARDRWRQCWRSWLGMLIVAALVAAPLLVHLSDHPSAQIRMGQLDRPLRALVEGDPRPLLENVLRTLRVFSFQGDTFVPYNIPGRPLLDPLMSLFFYAGLLIALARWRDPAHALALLWLSVGFFPALATGIEAANLRGIGAQPALFLFPALAFERLRRVRILRLRLSVLAGCLALTLLGFLTVRDYFVRWANDRDVRVHYHVELVRTAEMLQAWEGDEPVAISALYPGQYHDPRIVEAVLGENSPSLVWFDGRQTLALPSAQAPGLILSSSAALDERLWALVAPHATLLERVSLLPGDLTSCLELYQWSAGETLAALQTGMTQPAGAGQAPIDVGGKLAFWGYQVDGWTGGAGSEFDLLTLWQVESVLPADRDAVLFVQLLNGQGQVVAQQDQLGVPSWNWRAGDAFLQHHRLLLPAEMEAGQYPLILGVYSVPDRVDAVLDGREPDPAMPRLLVYEQGSPVADHLVLGLFEVE